MSDERCLIIQELMLGAIVDGDYNRFDHRSDIHRFLTDILSCGGITNPPTANEITTILNDWRRQGVIQVNGRLINPVKYSEKQLAHAAKLFEACLLARKRVNEPDSKYHSNYRNMQ